MIRIRIIAARQRTQRRASRPPLIAHFVFCVSTLTPTVPTGAKPTLASSADSLSFSTLTLTSASSRYLVTTTFAPLAGLTSLAAVYILSVEDNVVKPREEIERTLRRHLPELRRRFKARRIGIFGSVVRGEQRGRSDLDILVESSETPSILAIVVLKRHLTELTGEKVDLVPASALKPAYRQTILDEVVYA